MHRGGGSVNCTSSAAGADCVYLSEAQLEGDKLSTAAMPYIRLIDLVSYTSTGGEGSEPDVRWDSTFED
ncbi:hypothetical protein PLESTB_001269400 [Pleodorina starrii]|uniref:Uncharacterized protein n=1 Tax=Pleodorina starrii TaxID=330485 RepID=A0A9W6F6S3_9CHLO|nr:hypothetical protein PLESTB_001269400 [Pleodorina starrii]